MDTRNGEIHTLEPGEPLRTLANRLRVLPSDLVELSTHPDPACRHCKGTGVQRITATGRRIPCDCTGPVEAQEDRRSQIEDFRLKDMGHTAAEIPRARWGVIESGIYNTPDGSASIAYVDVVSDELLYRVSRGRRGFITYRSDPPCAMSDAMKQEALGSIRAQVAKLQRSAELAKEEATDEGGA